MRGASRSTRGATSPTTADQPDHDIPLHGAGAGHARSRTSPRHLGIHSGGMVICDRPVIEVCPVEWGRMDKRSVLQWDKDDCAAAGLVKFDLLGLGMLAALHYAVDLIREHRGYEVDLATIPQDDDVYDMLCRADTVGVFQIESRAQMATLPRLKPRTLLRPRGRGRAHPPRAHPGRVGASLHPPPQRPGAGHLPASAARELARQDARRAAVPGAADADGHRRRRVHARRGRRAAPGDGLEAQQGADGAVAGPAVRRAWPSAASPATSPTRSSTKMAAFANYGFPESHWRQLRLPRLRLVVDQVPRARRRSAPRCSTPSRWASDRRTRWRRTPAATVWWCAPPTSTPPWPAPRSSAEPHGVLVNSFAYRGTKSSQEPKGRGGWR